MVYNWLCKNSVYGVMILPNKTSKRQPQKKKSTNKVNRENYNTDERITKNVERRNERNTNAVKRQNQNSNNESQQRNAKKKKKSVLKTFLKLIVFVGLIIGIMSFLMISPMFNIEEIQVNNNIKLSSDTYISLSGVKYGENIYRISKKQIIEKIKENAYVKNVTIKRALPNKLIIEADERVATYMLQLGSSYMYIDNQGYMLEISEEKIEAPLLTGIKTDMEDIKVNNRLCEEDLEKLNDVLEIYQVAETTNVANLITEIDISNKSNYKLVLESEKKNVYIGEADNLINKFDWIKATIENTKGKKGDIHADRDLNTQPVYFSPEKKVEKKEDKKDNDKEKK